MRIIKMAKAAGIEAPKAKLFPFHYHYEYFGSKRFDKDSDHYYHVHSISGLLNIDQRELNLDYKTIMKTTLWLTKDVRECKRQFRLAVFNVLSHNRDDHAKNFSFLMDK